MNTPRGLRRLGRLPVSNVLEIGYAIFTIYHLSGALLLPSSPGAAADEGEARFYILNAGIYMVAFLLACRRPRDFWRAITADGYLLALVGLVVASALWAEAPAVAFRRAVALLGTSFFAVYLHVRYSLEDQLRLLGAGLGLGAVLSLGALAMDPGFLRGGMFAGVFDHKNALGRMMALATLVFLFTAWTRRRRAALGLAGLSFGLVLIANSATAMVALFTMLALIPLLKTLGRDARAVIWMSCVGLLVMSAGLLVASSSLDTLASALGRDVTLTGRTALWPFVLEMILRRPWLGYGYDTFWLEGLGFGVTVAEGAGWTAPNAHNGFLDVTLSLGVVGLLIYAASLGRGIARALTRLRREGAPSGLWPLLVLCFLILYNVTESTALARNSMLWVVYASTLLALTPERARSQRRRPEPRWRLTGRPVVAQEASRSGSGFQRAGLLPDRPEPFAEPPR